MNGLIPPVPASASLEGFPPPTGLGVLPRKAVHVRISISVIWYFKIF